MKKIFLLASFSVIVILLISCRTNQQSKITGTWKYISHSKPDTVSINEWSFYSGDLLEVKTSEEDDTTILSYSYTINGKVLDIFGDSATFGSYNPTSKDIRGEYSVDELNKTYLKCTKSKHADGSEGNPYLKLEFVKQ